MEQPNVIVLDEPTNDLDIQTLRILEDYLDGFPGIIITVSHDRYFLDRVVTRVFAFEPDGTLFQSEGGYSDYVEHKKENGSFSEIPAGSAAKGKTGSDNAEKNASKGKYRAPREKTKLSYKEQREYESIEAEIDALTEKSEELEKQIIEAATDFPNLMKYTKEKEAVDEEIEQKMERFIELQEMVDRFGLSK